MLVEAGKEAKPMLGGLTANRFWEWQLVRHQEAARLAAQAVVSFVNNHFEAPLLELMSSR